MDQVNTALAEARAFQEERKRDCAYYKYLDAGYAMLKVLEETALYDAESVKEESVIEMLGICHQSLERAEELLGAVIGISSKDACAASEKRILGPIYKTTDDTNSPFTLPLTQAEPYAKVIVKSDEGSPQRREPQFGKESGSSPRDDSELPHIPVSCVFVEHCRNVLYNQLLMQRIRIFEQASPQEQSNATFLRALNQHLELVREHTIEKLQLEKVIHASSRARVLDFDAKELAREITLLQALLGRRITKTELEIYGPTSGAEQGSTPNLTVFLEFSKYLRAWCQYEVLRYAEHQDRREVLEALVRVAMMLKQMGNFEGLMDLTMGLSSSSIQRMGKTMSALTKEHRNELNGLKTLISDNRSYSQLREAICKKDGSIVPPISMILSMEDPGLRAEYFNSWPELLNRCRYIRDGTQERSRLVQHYILTQPFKWDEELEATSRLREPIGGVKEECGAELTPEELERIKEEEGEYYEQVKKKIERETWGNIPKGNDSLTWRSYSLQ